jgi:hypothetical protein
LIDKGADLWIGFYPEIENNHPSTSLPIRSYLVDIRECIPVFSSEVISEKSIPEGNLIKGKTED